MNILNINHKRNQFPVNFMLTQHRFPYQCQQAEGCNPFRIMVQNRWNCAILIRHEHSTDFYFSPGVESGGT